MGMSDRQHTADRRRTAPVHWEDRVVYALILTGVYLLVGVLFFYGFKSKILDGNGAPPGIQKQFEGTFFETIPGVDAAWKIIGILEFVIFALTAASLAMREFLFERTKPLLLTALGLSIFTFSLLAVGQNVTGQTTGVAELFLYAGATGVLMVLIRQMPPYRPPNWLSARAPGGH
jgi:hypothetical protein